MNPFSISCVTSVKDPHQKMTYLFIRWLPLLKGPPETLSKSETHPSNPIFCMSMSKTHLSHPIFCHVLWQIQYHWITIPLVQQNNYCNYSVIIIIYLTYYQSNPIQHIPIQSRKSLFSCNNTTYKTDKIIQYHHAIFSCRRCSSLAVAQTTSLRFLTEYK